MSVEAPLVFSCGGESLVGILHRPNSPSPTALVIVVGGPQYRVGSHRQFILLARHVAACGFPVLRFDCRGMGDSSGTFPGFENIGDDISAACAALREQLPGIRKIALWGLCDAASAGLLYAEGGGAVDGLVLVNPWARSEATLAQTYLRHYYVQRFFSRAFWAKIFSGRLDLGRVVGDLAGNVKAGAAGRGTAGRRDFVERMREGLAAFRGPTLFLLSGNDLTAAEFAGVAATPGWRGLMQRPGVTQHRIEQANHTFSTRAWRDEVADVTVRWLAALDGGPAAP